MRLDRAPTSLADPVSACRRPLLAGRIFIVRARLGSQNGSRITSEDKQGQVTVEMYKRIVLV